MPNDPFSGHARGLESPATAHFAITPTDGADLTPRPRVLYVLTSGVLAIRDGAGVVIQYPVIAGGVLPFSAAGIEQTATTATVAGWV
jgi:hypothetical protein